MKIMVFILKKIELKFPLKFINKNKFYEILFDTIR
jgi:hypothetical protein